MRKYRPHIVGAVLGILGLAILPMAGVLPHQSDRPAGLVAWYGWMAGQQSVTLRSLTITAPDDLSHPDRPARAAGHYELVCATCHGSPARASARIALDLHPRPPPLAQGARWRPDARLFQTVRHGLRHTAMPAWPSPAREDEVWDMVALLRALPQMTGDDYRRLAGEAGSCRHCHGEQGRGRVGIPRLDTLSPGYIAASLRAFRDGTRASGTMIAVARGMDDDAIARAATGFGTAMPAPLPADDGSPGAALALRGDPARDIPACLSCHGRGDPAIYPALLGQQEEYLRRQLHLFSAEHPRRGGPRAALMTEAARWLTPDDIEALATWLEAQEGT